LVIYTLIIAYQIYRTTVTQAIVESQKVTYADLVSAGTKSDFTKEQIAEVQGDVGLVNFFFYFLIASLCVYLVIIGLWFNERRFNKFGAGAIVT
jgi:hypothetical protein